MEEGWEVEEGEEEKIEEEEEEEKERVGEEGIEDDIFSYGGLLVVLRSGMKRGDCLHNIGKSRRKISTYEAHIP